MSCSALKQSLLSPEYLMGQSAHRNFKILSLDACCETFRIIKNLQSLRPQLRVPY